MKQSYQIKVELDDETVKPIIGPYVRRIKELEKENADLLKNAIAQANSRMKEELEHYRSEMQLVYGRFASKKEKHNYDVFWKKHEKCRKSAKINEGKIPYVVEEETGVGTLRTVVCPICGEKKDITDTSVW